MKPSASILLLLLALGCAGAARAQTAPKTPFDDCPRLPAELRGALRWEVLRVPNMLLCRALAVDGGAEAFALTISRESPFRPRRGDRAEVGTLAGRPVQWYRGEVANQPDVQVREALIELGRDLVVHVFLRANDAETLARHQQSVLSLPFPAPAPD